MSQGLRRVLGSVAAVGVATALAGVAVPAAGAATESKAACEIPSERDLAVTKEMYQAASNQEDRVLLAAFEVGWVASHTNNLDCGQDGLGVFKVSPGGLCDSDAQCRDVGYVTKAFAKQAATTADANPDMTAGEIAQEVMRSAYPDRYDGAEDKANSLIDEAKKES